MCVVGVRSACGWVQAAPFCGFPHRHDPGGVACSPPDTACCRRWRQPPRTQGGLIPRVGVHIGEFGASDRGENSVSNSDTTVWDTSAVSWLTVVSSYFRTTLGDGYSWFWWCWQATSYGE
jgi:hypothetical protein